MDFKIVLLKIVYNQNFNTIYILLHDLNAQNLEDNAVNQRRSPLDCLVMLKCNIAEKCHFLTDMIIKNTNYLKSVINCKTSITSIRFTSPSSFASGICCPFCTVKT